MELRKLLEEVEHRHALKIEVLGPQYPRMRLQISKEEVDAMQAMGILTQDFKISESISSGKIILTPLEKLLYAMLWKNGDLGKENHIIKGILELAKESSGVVFNAFGAYLAGRQHHIVDQHTLRFVATYLAGNDACAVGKVRKLNTVNGRSKVHAEWAVVYGDLCELLGRNFGDCEMSDFIYVVDGIFFGAGKLIKVQIGNGNPAE